MSRLDTEDKQTYDRFLTKRFCELDYSLVGVGPKLVPSTGEYAVGKKKIACVAGDIGGFRFVETPLLRAQAADCEVSLFLVGSSAQAFHNGTLFPEGRFPVVHTPETAELISSRLQNDPNNLLVLAASQSPQGSSAAIIAANASVECRTRLLGTQDLYGSFHPILQYLGNHSIALDALCVTDEFSQDLILAAFPNVSHSAITVTGGPQFDKCAEVKQSWADRRKAIRGNLTDADLLVLVAGQLNGTAEMIALCNYATQYFPGRRVFVCLRTHPRQTVLDDYLTRLCSCSPLSFSIHAIPQIGTPASEDILPGADVVMSGYSTTNLYGIIYEIPGVVYVGTPSFRWDLWREKHLEIPPEVTAGAGWYVETPDDLVHVFHELQRGDVPAEVTRIREAQRRIAQYNDGHATERVWGVMQKLLA